VGTAKSLISWHARHGFCANCGAKTKSSHGGWRRDCAGCNAQHFPRVDPVVIMLAVDGDRALLARGSNFINSMYSALAGFIEPGETIEDAVRRELFEEAGIRVGQVRYHSSQPWPFPSTLMIGCFARAETTELTIDADEIADAAWFTRDEITAMLAFEDEQGRMVPPPSAIAHQLVTSFIENEAILES
ncbi:MAG: NAD(+) diphosphatase, partial [Tepidamorphaceae bacterium]